MYLNLFNFNFISRLLYSRAFFLSLHDAAKIQVWAKYPQKYIFISQTSSWPVGPVYWQEATCFYWLVKFLIFFSSFFSPSGSRGGWWSIFLLYMGEGRVHPWMSGQWAFGASAPCSTVPQRHWTRKICSQRGLNREHSTSQANRLSYCRPINESLLQSSSAIARSRSLFRSDNERHKDTEKCQK